jgi:hypothetical protein
MYLGLHPPWRHASVPPTIAVAPVAVVDAGVAPSKKKKGRRIASTSTEAGQVEREIDDDVALTAADRKMEWRGDAVAVPARTLDMASGDEARQLDDGEIASGVNGGSNAMIACIKDAAGGAPLSGEVTVQMLVGGDGRVTKVRLRAAAYLHEHGLTACGRRAARSFDFPATGLPTVVTAPFFLN